MNTEKIVHSICIEAKKIDQEIPCTEWYIFGSILKNSCSAADVDLLVLCRDVDDASAIRKLLTQLSSSIPIHLFLATYEEEEELNFVEEQECRKLYPK